MCAQRWLEKYRMALPMRAMRPNTYELDLKNDAVRFCCRKSPRASRVPGATVLSGFLGHGSESFFCGTVRLDKPG